MSPYWAKLIDIERSVWKAKLYSYKYDSYLSVLSLETKVIKEATVMRLEKLSLTQRNFLLHRRIFCYSEEFFVNLKGIFCFIEEFSAQRRISVSIISIIFVNYPENFTTKLKENSLVISSFTKIDYENIKGTVSRDC